MNNNMFYVAYYDTRLKCYDCELYCDDEYGWKKYHEDTFSPCIEVKEVIPFRITGKTYQERKENLRHTAITWESCQYTKYYSIVWMVRNWIYDNAKRYGLVKEFSENLVI